MSFNKFNGKKICSLWPVFFVSLLGIGAFFLIVGPLALNPTNVAWLAGGYDPTQHYLGWVFFRQSPWSLPLGLNPNFGMDISSSIIYSDSIPLFAFLFKLLAETLPETFQYFGFWLLLCFILQGYFSWRLISLLDLPGTSSIIATILFIFSPPMFWRIGMHAALTGHWLILAAIYLNFRSSRSYRLIYWASLVCIAALVHFYLLTMVLGLCFASLLDDMRSAERYVQGRSITVIDSAMNDRASKNRVINIVSEFFAIVLVTLAVMWLAGYFVVSGSATATLSYGISRMNLLAPIDSNNWSYFMPNIPDTQGSLSDIDMTARTYENMMYWGAGNIFLIVSVIYLYLVNQIRTKVSKSKNLIELSKTQASPISLSWASHGGLYIVLIAFTLFALSNQLAAGSWSWNFSIPKIAYQIASIYRASSRFFWPVWYVTVFLAMAYLMRYISYKRLSVCMIIFALVQIIDTYAGWSSVRNLTMKSARVELPSELRDPFWAVAGTHYKALVRIPVDPLWVKVLPSFWSTFAVYAAKYHLQTNSTYLARQSEEKLSLSNAQLHRMLSIGQWKKDTLYILGNEEVRMVLEKSNSQEDLFARIDGHNVFAPGWLSCGTCTPVSEALRITSDMVQTKLGQPIKFDTLGNGKYFLQGPDWAYPESWGVWSVGYNAKINLPLPKADSKKNALLIPSVLILKTRALVNSIQKIQKIFIGINGRAPIEYSLINDEDNTIKILLNQSDLTRNFLQLDFYMPDARRPRDLGIGDDERLLSVGMISATFYTSFVPTSLK